jgi:hypothetical protein
LRSLCEYYLDSNGLCIRLHSLSKLTSLFFCGDGVKSMEDENLDKDLEELFVEVMGRGSQDELATACQVIAIEVDDRYQFKTILKQRSTRS